MRIKQEDILPIQRLQYRENHGIAITVAINISRIIKRLLYDFGGVTRYLNGFGPVIFRKTGL